MAPFRVQSTLGRTFSAEDDTPGTPETVILSFGYWQRRFGGASEVLGEVLTVDGRPHEIVPRRRDLQVQNLLKRRRCQRMTVSG